MGRGKEGKEEKEVGNKTEKWRRGRHERDGGRGRKEGKKWYLGRGREKRRGRENRGRAEGQTKVVMR